MENMAKNLKKILCAVGVLLLALVFRLGYIQIIGGDELAEAAHSQSLISLEGGNTRGIIYDKSGTPLVADKKRFVYIIKEDKFNYQTGQLFKDINAKEVSSDNEGYYVYSSEKYDKAIGEKLIEKYGAYILETSARYSDKQIAANLIGYVNKKDLSGASGLELMFDDELSVLNRRIYAAADVKGNILTGRGLIITSDKQGDSSIREGIRTTLDKDMQQAVEEIIGKSDKNCAVVILDVNTGGVAAMASTPSFNPNNIEEHIKNGSSELLNKATQGEYAPGSIFKIVVAAAALEDEFDASEEFDCAGSVKIGNIEIGCETGGEEGHGKINLKDAFSDSCNSYFIKLGQEIGYDKIKAMAEKMGLGRKTLEDYPQESTGHIMTSQESYGAGIGNLSIGQGQMLITPVQAARMTNIIASGGIDKGVHILMEDESDEKQVISKNTADKIMDMMMSVTENGTASYLGLKDDEGNPKASVKTGTAEYGKKEEQKSHGWITGYTPCDNPEYVITVFMEGGKSGSSDVGPIYKAIINYLEDSGSYSKPTLA
ncbi:MAG: peptidoglycan D,D-transpeptidase FtsI family protein [Anaerovoracaceae bacterium]